MILFFKKNKQKENKQTDKIFNWKKFFNFSEINKQFYEDLEESLILSDIGGENTLEIIHFLKNEIEAKKIKEIETAKNILKKYLNRSLLNKKVEFSQDKLKVIIIVGINGVGKTTTIGKLIYFFQEKKITVGAGDTYRAAAKEQLKVWTDRFKVRLISQQPGSDAASVTYDTIHSALNQKDELAIVDTAGRLHNKENLLKQLAKINRICDKFEGQIDKDIFLVLDSTQGLSGYEQAINFNKKLPISGIILTKIDSQAKGGVLYSICKKTKIPISLITYGESPEKIKTFDENEYIDSII